MHSLTLFNTLSRKKEEIARSSVSLYTCGPTVYNYAHIGNLRTYLFEDLLKRTLLFLGYDVKHVMNITDVDDKTIQGAVKKGISLDEFCAVFTEAFLEDLSSLQVLPADEYPKATEHIDHMIAMIENLVEKKHAYKSLDGSVYFSIRSYKDYGKLSGLRLEELQEGASKRVHADEYNKESASDFVLWKAYDPARDGNIFWNSPFGKGRPGWHIECSAMCLHHLGESVDIHCGGVDNIFPHHENEIAQSQCFTGKEFVRMWCHAAHLIVDGQKMSKSKNNFYTLRSLLEEGYHPLEVRYLLLHTHYRSPLNFTFEGLRGAKAALSRIHDFVYRLENTTATQENAQTFGEKYLEIFRASLADDLNISSALGAVFDLIREGNLLMDEGKLSVEYAETLLQILRSMDRVIGVFFPVEKNVPEAVQTALHAREKARKEKNWKEADRLRQEISSLGYVIEDTPSGARIKLE